MSQQLTTMTEVHVNFDVEQIPSIVERIKECHGKAYSAFSGCPISLCKSLERRGEARVKFDEPIVLRPVRKKGTHVYLTSAPPIIGVTRDISPHGVGFSYDKAIETNYVLAEFDLYGSGSVTLLLDLRWQKQTDHFAFVGGGLIVGFVTEDHSASA